MVWDIKSSPLCIPAATTVPGRFETETQLNPSWSKRDGLLSESLTDIWTLFCFACVTVQWWYLGVYSLFKVFDWDVVSAGAQWYHPRCPAALQPCSLPSDTHWPLFVRSRTIWAHGRRRAPLHSITDIGPRWPACTASWPRLVRRHIRMSGRSAQYEQYEQYERVQYVTCAIFQIVQWACRVHFNPSHSSYSHSEYFDFCI